MDRRADSRGAICGWKSSGSSHVIVPVMNAPPDLVFEDFSGCLIVRISGRTLVDDKEATIRAIAKTVKARDPKAVLADMRNVPGPITFMDRYKIGELAGKHLIGFHLAVLAREEQTDQKRIGQLVAQNRGARLEAIFCDEALALAWLKQYTKS